MSNHVHVIFQADKGDLSDLVRDFKVFTAKKILETIQTGNESRQDWMMKRSSCPKVEPLDGCHKASGLNE